MNMTTKTFVTALIIASILVSCAPVTITTPTATDIPIAILPTVHPTSTDIPTPYPTLQLLPSKTPTPALKPVLISYTLRVDGGDELVNCVDGSNQPVFILYNDGELITFRDGQYWQSLLSQDEIASLFSKISDTGLLQSLEKNYDNSSVTLKTLFIQGKMFLPPSNAYNTSSFKKIVDIIGQYQPKTQVHWIPDSLTLWIASTAQIEPFEEFLPKPIPPVQNWNKELKPLKEYGDGYKNVSGEMVPKIMTQFDGFPDYQIFSEGNLLYITAICANIPEP
jgi:hypothetical protein